MTQATCVRYTVSLFMLCEHSKTSNRERMVKTVPDNKGTVVVVVAGTEVVVSFNENEPLKNVVNEALRESGNGSRKAEDWQLKFSGIPITDLSRKVRDYNFPADAVLYLSLSEGTLG